MNPAALGAQHPACRGGRREATGERACLAGGLGAYGGNQCGATGSIWSGIVAGVGEAKISGGASQARGSRMSEVSGGFVEYYVGASPQKAAVTVSWSLCVGYFNIRSAVNSRPSVILDSGQCVGLARCRVALPRVSHRSWHVMTETRNSAGIKHPGTHLSKNQILDICR